MPNTCEANRPNYSGPYGGQVKEEEVEEEIVEETTDDTIEEPTGLNSDFGW